MNKEGSSEEVVVSRSRIQRSRDSTTLTPKVLPVGRFHGLSPLDVFVGAQTNRRPECSALVLGRSLFVKSTAVISETLLRPIHQLDGHRTIR